MARGLDNCNPGNIRKTADKWQGLADIQDDPAFFKFKSADWGIRAGAIILIGYYDRDGLDTISGIISKWAPASENDTAAYIKDVCNRSVFTADKKLNLHEYADIYPLVKAIIWHENGEMPYDDTIINMGLARAGIEIPKRSLLSTKTIKGAGIAIAGASGGIGVTLLENTPALANYSTDHYTHLACSVLTACGIGLTIFGKVKDSQKSITG